MYFVKQGNEKKLKQIYQVLCRLSNCVWWNKNRERPTFKTRQK